MSILNTTYRIDLLLAKVVAKKGEYLDARLLRLIAQCAIGLCNSDFFPQIERILKIGIGFLNYSKDENRLEYCTLFVEF